MAATQCQDVVTLAHVAGVDGLEGVEVAAGVVVDVVVRVFSNDVGVQEVSGRQGQPLPVLGHDDEVLSLLVRVLVQEQNDGAEGETAVAVRRQDLFSYFQFRY